jgi:thiazole/oxazole-forming peptide maturase SagD family component
VQRLLFLPAEIDTVCGHFAREFSKILPHIPETLTVVFALDLKTPALTYLSKRPDPILLVSASQGCIYIGPCAVPGRSVCFACLQHWILTAGFDRLPEPPPTLEEAELASELVIQALDEFRNSGRVQNLSRGLIVMQTVSRNYAFHPIFPLKNCPHCQPLRSTDDLDLHVHVSPLTGIVRSMTTTTNTAAGAFRAMAKWVNPLPAGASRALLDLQESHGRGATREDAQLGCIGEALERYSLIFRGDEPLVRARMAELPALDPRSILLYSGQQYLGRRDWNRHADERYFVPEPFDPEAPIDWIAGIDLHTRQQVFAPAACCLMWYQFRPGETEYASADTVGCGSGRSFNAALLHALLEWIERDAMAIWWYNRLQRPAVRLESFEDQRLLDVQDGLRRIGRQLWLLDVTTDTGVPTYISVSCRSDGSEPLFAGAAHVSPRIAAWKAASEVGQIWFTALQAQAIDADFGKWLTHATLESQPYLAPAHVVEAPPEAAAVTLAEELEFVVSRLRSVNLEPVAVDLSRPDVALRTVRALVPGLRHIWNRCAPGRIYDVPVRLGWLEAPLVEDELNSICCMI